MFRVAIIVNENEVAHSAFADTRAILERPVGLGDQKRHTYRFAVFDKYSVHRLFLRENDDHLSSFDSLIIATNATNNVEVLTALRANAAPLEDFLRQGRGLLICSQKKLSKKASTGADSSAGFLPNRYDYRLIDRPEGQSAEGYVATVVPSDRLFRYPNEVTSDLVEAHCENNDFMVHRYRSHIVPLHPSQYLPLLADTRSPPVDDNLRVTLDGSRALLLRSGSLTERIVITSMALDWAGHEELLENILVYITEGIDQLAVLRRRDSRYSRAMDAYVIRARVGKIPIREYFDIPPSEVAGLQHKTLVISPAYTTVEVDEIWAGLTSLDGKSTDLYHMTPEASTGGFRLHRRSRRSALDGISASAGAWLARVFFPDLWGRSIWTYNYVLPMMIRLGIDVSPYLPRVFAEISKHVPPDIAPDACYDHVVNASAQLLEVLGSAFVPTSFSYDVHACPRPPKDLFNGCAKWLLAKLSGAPVQPRRERLYVLNSLWRASYEPFLDDDSRLRVWTIATDTLHSYRTQPFQSCDTVELTQLLALVLKLAAAGRLSHDELNTDTSAILSVLRSRQGVDGDWRNVSETGEVTLALLRLSQEHASFLDDQRATAAILEGVAFLLRDFDPTLGNWQEDINATAKAAHALALFDEHSGLSGSDYFDDIQARMTRKSESESLTSTLSRHGELLNVLFQKEGELVAQDAQLAAKEHQVAAQTSSLRHWRLVTYGAVVIAVITTAMVFTVALILLVSYPEVAIKILGDWQGYLVGGLVGIVLSLLVAGPMATAKARIIEEGTTTGARTSLPTTGPDSGPRLNSGSRQ